MSFQGRARSNAFGEMNNGANRRFPMRDITFDPVLAQDDFNFLESDFLSDGFANAPSSWAEATTAAPAMQPLYVDTSDSMMLDEDYPTLSNFAIDPSPMDFESFEDQQLPAIEQPSLSSTGNNAGPSRFSSLGSGQAAVETSAPLSAGTAPARFQPFPSDQMLTDTPASFSTISTAVPSIFDDNLISPCTLTSPPSSFPPTTDRTPYGGFGGRWMDADTTRMWTPAPISPFETLPNNGRAASNASHAPTFSAPAPPPLVPSVDAPPFGLPEDQQLFNDFSFTPFEAPAPSFSNQTADAPVSQPSLLSSYQAIFGERSSTTGPPLDDAAVKVAMDQFLAEALQQQQLQGQGVQQCPPGPQQQQGQEDVEDEEDGEEGEDYIDDDLFPEGPDYRVRGYGAWREGMVSPGHFEMIVGTYIDRLAATKKRKAIMSPELEQAVLEVCREPNNKRLQTAQFRYWVRHHFLYEVFVTDDGKWADRVLDKKNRMVATEDQMYQILCHAHGPRHPGRDRTTANVMKIWGWIPKDICSMFVSECPGCRHRYPDKPADEDDDKKKKGKGKGSAGAAGAKRAPKVEGGVLGAKPRATRVKKARVAKEPKPQKPPQQAKPRKPRARKSSKAPKGGSRRKKGDEGDGGDGGPA